MFESVAHLPERDGDISFAVLHGLYWLTINLASEGRLLIALDDLHWCDRPSLRFLAYLSRRLEGLDALLVVGLRTAEPGTDPVMIGEIAAAPEVLHVHPVSLSEGGVADLIRGRLDDEPDPEFVAACRSATGGNPVLLRQPGPIGRSTKICSRPSTGALVRSCQAIQGPRLPAPAKSISGASPFRL